jgi:hypothetical protein
MFTGNAAAPATISAKARLPQNSTLPSPASIAPGIASMMALSTISMMVIEIVSAARASLAAAANASPERSSGRMVNA